MNGSLASFLISGSLFDNLPPGKVNVVAGVILGDANGDGMLGNPCHRLFVLSFTNPVAYQALGGREAARRKESLLFSSLNVSGKDQPATLGLG
jgi:hypothetical protein